MKFPNVEKVLAATNQGEISSITLDFMYGRKMESEADWDAWEDVRDTVQTAIMEGLGKFAESAEEIEWDEMAGIIHLDLKFNMTLGTTQLPADLLSTFSKACQDAFAVHMG